eukprot:12955.XXX_261057_259256_1 [CDS] Oithona nana genome sequencing.
MSGSLHQNDASISPHQPAVIVTDSELLSADRRRIEPWELAFSNGGAIMDEIPMPNRNIHEQLAFRSNRHEQPQNAEQIIERRKTLDANRYATKKTIAQGMLDVALLTANASQLKYVLQVGEDNHPFYHLMLALIILSIILQVVTALLLFVVGTMNVDETKNEKLLMILNHTALAFSFGSMFTDTIKFVFVHDTNRGFPTSKINTELEL